MTCHEIITRLQKQANPTNVAGMARFGISTEKTLGIPIPTLRALAKEVGRDHDLALELWQSGWHEARILAGMIDEPLKVTRAQLERWAKDFDSWDTVDQVCSNLIGEVPGAWDLIPEWTAREEEFIRRAGFTLIAVRSVHDKKATAADFKPYIKLIEKGATDERNFVKKAVNWALRQIGKQGGDCATMAVACARRLKDASSKSARWIGSDALREFQQKGLVT